MNKKLLFLGPLYPIERELEIKENTVSGMGNAPNVYQWNLINGLYEIVRNDLQIINVLPVGTWKNSYKKLFLKDSDWYSRKIAGHEIGTINVPFLKQLRRYQKTKKLLEKIVDENTEIIIYSAYMPFLKAVYNLSDNVKVTTIITDLPEYYDLAQKTSSLRKKLRVLQNQMIYKYLERIDRFVVLTKQMCVPLHVGNRPWICIEGVCNSEFKTDLTSLGDKKIIFYSGTLHYQYGIKNLLEAFKSLDQDDIELWICGSGEAEKEIESLAEKDKRVKFYGFCTQLKVAELRSKAAILVNPRPNVGEYVKYSFPSKTMEYMASGKPVVMYKLDGIPDEYDAYLNYVCSSGDVSNEIKKALLKVLNNYEDARAKASLGKKFVLENKNSTAQAKKLLNFMAQS